MTTTLPADVDAPSRWRRVRTPTWVAGALIGASVLLHVRDPHHGGSWGFCPWLTLTGTYCPGCGGLRAVNDLTNGDVGAAASSNLLFVGSLPLVAVSYVRWFVGRWRGVDMRVSTTRAFIYAGLFLSVAVLFWVARNLAFGQWLSP